MLFRSKKLNIPPLRNIPAQTPLRPFLLQKRVISDIEPDAQNIDPSWIQQFLAQLGEVQDKLKRLLFKSLGGILGNQDQILRQWRANGAGAATGVAVSEQ